MKRKGRNSELRNSQKNAGNFIKIINFDPSIIIFSRLWELGFKMLLNWTNQVFQEWAVSNWDSLIHSTNLLLIMIINNNWFLNILHRILWILCIHWQSLLYKYYESNEIINHVLIKPFLTNELAKFVDHNSNMMRENY